MHKDHVSFTPFPDLPQYSRLVDAFQAGIEYVFDNVPNKYMDILGTAFKVDDVALRKVFEQPEDAGKDTKYIASFYRGALYAIRIFEKCVRFEE